MQQEVSRNMHYYVCIFLHMFTYYDETLAKRDYLFQKSVTIAFQHH